MRRMCCTGIPLETTSIGDRAQRVAAAAAAVRLQPMIDGRNGQLLFRTTFFPSHPLPHTQTYYILYYANSLYTRTTSTRTRTYSYACIQRSMNPHRSCARSPRQSVLLFMSMRAHRLPSQCAVPAPAPPTRLVAAPNARALLQASVPRRDLLQATLKQKYKQHIYHKKCTS